MPSWPIHLAIAKKVNEKLKLNKDLFYYGNLIPDVDRNSPINKYKAHYYDNNLPYFNCPKEHMININLFLKDYKDDLTNPLILGYYCHLLADYYYNLNVYTTKWLYDDKNNIILEVKNRGEPIPKDEQEKIFDRFYRVDESRNRNNNRYGLGLAIAKEIVELHNGKIIATSNNLETVFEVVLPLYKN